MTDEAEVRPRTCPSARDRRPADGGDGRAAGPAETDDCRVTAFPWPAPASLFGSGTGALVALVGWGAQRDGWRRVWLPSYYCPEVPAGLRSLEADGIEILTYPDHDLSAPPAVERIAAASGDVVVVANQLGVRPCPDPAALAAVVAAKGAILVEDHSHDPGSQWARRSRADYAFASLRKTLPLPDGGAAWSPRGLDLPPEPAGATTRGTAMSDALDRRRASSAPATDSLPFRALARSGAPAALPGSGAPIAATSRALLPHMPIDAWRDRRRRNLGILATAVGPIRGGRLLPSPPGGVAFAFTVAFDDPADRERVRESLVARAVVPAILWPIEASSPGAGSADVELSRRVLSVQCDQRYGDHDMRVLGTILRTVLTA